MNKEELLTVLQKVSSGELSADAALKEIKIKPYDDLGFA